MSYQPISKSVDTVETLTKSKLASIKRLKYGLKFNPFSKVKDRTEKTDLEELDWVTAELAKAQKELARYKFKETRRLRLLDQYKRIDAEKQAIIERQNKTIDKMVERNQKMTWTISDLKFKLEHLTVKMTMFKTVY